MLQGVAAAAAEKGYARLAVADVIERAGVSRKTFYEHFANKEECFLAAYDAGVEALLAAIDAAVTAASSWLEAVHAGTRCYLEMLAANPAFAHTFLIEVQGAGAAAIARRTAVHRRFAEQLAGTHRQARRALGSLPEPPPHAFRACVGAVHELVVDHLLAQGAETLPELEDRLVDIELRLLVGRELDSVSG
jgi:AcrR family transcriptional regulator